MWEVPGGSGCFGMTSAAFLEQWEEGNMALRKSRELFHGGSRLAGRKWENVLF